MIDRPEYCTEEEWAKAKARAAKESPVEGKVPTAKSKKADTALDACPAEEEKVNAEIKRLAGLRIVDYEKLRKEKASVLG